MTRPRLFRSVSYLCSALFGLLLAMPSVADHIVISDKQIVQPLPGKTVAVGYMTITNDSDTAVELLSVTDGGDGTTAKLAVEMHESAMSDGRMRMVQHDSLTIAPNASLQLQPHGYHLMLFNWQMIGVQSYPLVLQFDDGSSVRLEFPVTAW